MIIASYPDIFSSIIDMIIIPKATHCLRVIVSCNTNTPAAPASAIVPTLNTGYAMIAGTYERDWSSHRAVLSYTK